jgi:hypothetical protein
MVEQKRHKRHSWNNLLFGWYPQACDLVLIPVTQVKVWV